jgi:hypothetical protein
VTSGEPHDLWPADLHERAAEVFTFIQGHLVVQAELDDDTARPLAAWIALITADIGAACAALTSRPSDADAERTVVAWLACASADALRARFAFSPVDRAGELAQLHAGLVSAQMSEPAWRPVIQTMFVIAALGEVVAAARPIVTADPADHGPVPRFDRLVAETLLHLRPELAAKTPPESDDEETLDPVTATSWALEDLARAAGGAAVLLHPGGPVGMPADPG